tara:strand:+ start:4612 stop:5481 length:870 start_codon:yes stop_codon:yes gene_type:complete
MSHNYPQEDLVSACQLCGSSKARIYTKYPEFTWVRCECDLIYKKSTLPEKDDKGIYGSLYFKAGENKHAHSYDERRRRRIKKSKTQILDALNYIESGPLLDVGCSLGYTLHAAEELGLESVGIDIAPFALEARRKQNYHVKFGSLNEMPFKDGEFGIITMKHVLEHTSDPRSALHEAHRVLRKGGVLFIAIPNANYYKAAINPKSSRFYHPDCPGGTEHFIYYTSDTLTRLLEDVGYSIPKVNFHFFHKRASTKRKIVELIVSPFLILGRLILNNLRLKKEFWLVAIRN